MYETAWTRELAFLFGSSSIAIAAVLGAYMGGLALGAAAAARFAPRVARPVWAYGILELTIALAALALPLGLALVNLVYAGIFGGEPAPPPEGAGLATTFQLGAAFLLLLIPTSCMGATLPLLARHVVESDQQLGPRIGALYATNTAGAICGVVVAAFLLLPEIGLRSTVYVGVAVNIAVFGVACLIGRPVAPPPAKPRRRGVFSWVLPVIAVSGAASFVYEVLWIRMLVHQLGSSVYAFATMLGSFLAGIALGGALAAPIARRREHAALAFVLAEVAAGVLGLATFLMADQLPAMATALGVENRRDLAGNALVCALVLVPLSTAIGATFPLAVRLAAQGVEDAAAASARVFAWNTMGSIAGSLGAALCFLPLLGFEGTAQLAVGVNFALAAIVATKTGRRGMAAAAASCVVFTALVPFPLPERLVHQSLTGVVDEDNLVYFAVGRSATVLLSRGKHGLELYTDGLAEATITTPDAPPLPRRVPDWMGLLPTLMRPDAQRLLVIGLGGASMLEAVPPSIKRIDVIEIEEEVIAANRAAAAERLVDPLQESRIHLYVNDARGALMLSEAHYDGIVAQASHPWTAGSSHLYTREFFELVKGRLSPEGVFVQWMGLDFVDEPLLRSLVGTLSSVFEHVTVFNPGIGRLLFVSSNAPLRVIPNAREALRRYRDTFAKRAIYTPEDVAAALAFDEAGTRQFGAEAVLNTDDRNLLATRSVQVGPNNLANRFQLLVQPLDPLNNGLGAGLRGVRIVRALVALGQLERAKRFAQSLSDGDREIALGWVAMAEGRPRQAMQRFRVGLAGGGEPSDGQAGIALVTRDTLPEELEGPARTLAEARLLGFARNWAELALLDDNLAAIPSRDALFLEASRLRALWRMAVGRNAEAAQILSIPLTRGAAPRRYHALKEMWSRAASGEQRPEGSRKKKAPFRDRR